MNGGSYFKIWIGLIIGATLYHFINGFIWPEFFRSVYWSGVALLGHWAFYGVLQNEKV